MKKIVQIIVNAVPDDFPPTAWMGTYSNLPKNNYAIDRRARGHMKPNEYRWFNPPIENYDGESEDNIKKFIEEDYARMESLNNGEWAFVGIQAEAEIHTSLDGIRWVVQYIHSPGIWGIESDSDWKPYKWEQIDDLRDILLELGFTNDEISKAVNENQTKGE